MSKDAIDRMLDEIGRRRTPDEPLALTAIGVFYEELEEERISDIEMESLAIVGYAAVKSEEGAWPVGPPAPWPAECPPSVCELLDADVSHEQLDAHTLPGDVMAMLAIVGLWTVGGERFMRADADN